MEQKAEPMEQEINFEELNDNKSSGPPRDLEFLLDIPLLVSVELGRTKMLINDLVAVRPGFGGRIGKTGR